jgi:hypothetical protein
MRLLRESAGSMEGIRRRRVTLGKEDFDLDAASAPSDDEGKVKKLRRVSSHLRLERDVVVSGIDYVYALGLFVSAFVVRFYHISAINTVIFDEVRTHSVLIAVSLVTPYVWSSWSSRSFGLV